MAPSFSNDRAEPINFRRLAGSRLYRSSAPEGVTSGDIFWNHGVKTILDLRNPSEVKSCTELKSYPQYRLHNVAAGQKPVLTPLDPKKAPQTSASSGKGRHIVLPLVDHKMLIKQAPVCLRIIIMLAYIIDQLCGTHMAKRLTIYFWMNREGQSSLLWLYKHIVDHHGRGICTALRFLSEPDNVPAVVMCAMGKDRTGVVCLLLGHICGQSSPNLLQHYTESQVRFDTDPNHWLVRGVKSLRMHPCFAEAREEFMQGLLDHIRYRYGSVDGYLRHIGFSPDEQEALRKNISEQ